MNCEEDISCFEEATMTLAVGRDTFRSFCRYHGEALMDASLAVSMDYYEEVIKENLQPSWMNRKWVETAA